MRFPWAGNLQSRVGADHESESAIHLYADALLVAGAGERPPVSDYIQLSRGDSEPWNTLYSRAFLV
jgi:hypothetical protein